jgi:hypothetical protein
LETRSEYIRLGECGYHTAVRSLQRDPPVQNAAD